MSIGERIFLVVAILFFLIMICIKIYFYVIERKKNQIICPKCGHPIKKGAVSLKEEEQKYCKKCGYKL
ncbi:MAG TPA: zinc ribbon domain-containing protein [Candidatus Merdenecus merdavium]|nr:zinc ribbon domain-containing protein [Candidatus Merdenecus merdavium]